MTQPEHRYALYVNGKNVGEGTTSDLAKYLGVTKEHIRFMSTPAHMRRIAARKDTAKYTVKLGTTGGEQ